MEFYLEVKCLDTFKDVIAQGLKIEKALIKKVLVKIYKDNKDDPQPAYNTDKPKFWSRNMNVTNDGIVDARKVDIAQPTVSLQGPIQSSFQNKSQFQENNTMDTNKGLTNINHTTQNGYSRLIRSKTITSKTILDEISRKYEKSLMRNMNIKKDFTHDAPYAISVFLVLLVSKNVECTKVEKWRVGDLCGYKCGIISLA